MSKRFATWALVAAVAAMAASPLSSAAEETEAELEAKLRAAHEKLTEAAREVAELSAKMSQEVLHDSLAFHGSGMPRAIIGVQLMNDDDGGGARVHAVSPGGPAARAGVLPGDLIVAVNGVEVKGPDAARKVVEEMWKVEPESTVKLRLLRDGKPRELEVTARAVRPGDYFSHALDSLAKKLPLDPDDWRDLALAYPLYREFADMELTTLTPQLGRYFGTEKGVLVLRAPRSEAIQLEDGDVILSIDGREPQSASHVTRILRSYQPGEKLTLRIMRQHKEMNLVTTIPEKSRPRHKAPRGPEGRA